MRFLFLAILAFAPSLAACIRASCNGEAFEPPVITVVNSSTGALICDAEMTASRAGFADIPLVGSPASGCEYFPVALSADGGVLGAESMPPGTYTLTVSRDGFASATVPGVVAQTSSCDGPPAQAQVVTVKLTPL